MTNYDYIISKVVSKKLIRSQQNRRAKVLFI